MQNPIISVSGLRGIIGESLAPSNAMQYVAAFASGLPAGPIVLTRDGRSSGPMLADAIGSALVALGRDVFYGNVAATPTTGILVRTTTAVGGVQISASHNPPEYNGIKLFGGDGRVLSADAGQRVIDALPDTPRWVAWDRLGHHTRLTSHAIDPHLSLVLKTVDVQAIRRRGFTVVLDSNHGAGSVLGQRLLEALGVNAIILGGEPDGQFAHPPEPTSENLKSVASAALSHQADVVFCQDPDADRLAIISENGVYIGEEYTLALTLENRLSQEPGDCVINCATSRMSIDIAEQFGCRCHLSAVGEANVCDLMQQTNAVYGGEGNGGPIDPRVGYVRDSFVAMAQILDLMARTGQTIGGLVDELPCYSIHKTRLSIDRSRLPEIYRALQGAFPTANSGNLDGLRLDWPDRWLLVRPSNTEPIVRIICEAESPAAAAALADQAREIIAD